MVRFGSVTELAEDGGVGGSPDLALRPCFLDRDDDPDLLVAGSMNRTPVASLEVGVEG